MDAKIPSSKEEAGRLHHFSKKLFFNTFMWVTQRVGPEAWAAAWLLGGEAASCSVFKDQA